MILLFTVIWIIELIIAIVLGQEFSDYRLWLGIVFFFLVQGFGAVLFYWGYQRFQKERGLFRKVTALLETFSDSFEFSIFDRKGQSIFTNSSHKYPHSRDFLRKLMMKIAPSSESVAYKDSVEAGKRESILLSSGHGELSDRHQQFWIAWSHPFIYRDQHFLGVGLWDVTDLLAPYRHLKHQHLHLQTFLDRAPFGILYTNKTKRIVGINQTLCDWLGYERDYLLGQNLDMIVEGMPSDLSVQSMYVSLNPYRKEKLRTLVFSTDKKEGFALIFCSVEGGMVPFASSDQVTHETFQASPIPSVVLDQRLRIVVCNTTFAHLVGEHLVVQSDKLKLEESFETFVHPEQKDELSQRLKEIFKTGIVPSPFDISFKIQDRHTTAYVNIISSTHLVLQFIDTSEQKRLEQQFIQSQKMQAVGQLAGGIAHDFNNLLTAMIGFCDLLLQRYMPNDPSYTDIIQIKQNANRAANLVRQLLAFSRQQTLQPRVIQITDTLGELSALLRRLLGASIELKLIHRRDLWHIKVDPGQFEQVVINLAVNARDAMSQGGVLTIQTGHHQAYRPQRIGHETMPSGEYVLIEVSDTGHGISPNNMEHIFEPFFSTKDVGAGTGLGLSTVYGIIKQTGGFIHVESEIDEGTTFKIFIPRYSGTEEVLSSHTDTPTGDLSGTETLLLVEDEDAVRLFSTRALRDKGYRVLEASSGEAALEIAEKEPFDLLITDVVMPKMDGPTLCRKICDIYPEMRTIFISGYTEDTFRKDLGHSAHIHFLAKPFTLKDLASKVKDVLKDV